MTITRTSMPPTLVPTQTRRSNTLKIASRKLACRRMIRLLCLLCAAMSITASAQTFTSLAGFDNTNGANPYGALAQGSDGNFYGTTQFGGANGQGAVYQVTPDGTLTAIYSFCSLTGCTDGGQPFSGLQLGFDQNFYGTTPGTVFRITTAGQLTTLYTFCSLLNCADGTGVYAPLMQAPGGDFYGTTANGGIDTFQCGGGCGTIFKITPNGAFTTLYTFHGKDGYAPFDGLVQGTNGNLYGTTNRGGAHGAGTVFMITPAGILTLLHSFSVSEGSGPYGRLLQAADGNFYGTTTAGGTRTYGAVFKMTPAGKLTVLRSFDLTNGSTPYAGLLQGADGNFYGTTYTGGNGTSCPLGACGTAFRLSPSGRLTTLYNFCSQSGCPDGGAPFGGLTQGTDGNLYGATLLGGSACGADGSCGTIFKLTLGLP